MTNEELTKHVAEGACIWTRCPICRVHWFDDGLSKVEVDHGSTIRTVYIGNQEGIE